MIHDAEQFSHECGTALTEKLRTEADKVQQHVTVASFEAKQPFIGERETGTNIRAARIVPTNVMRMRTLFEARQAGIFTKRE